MQYTYNKVYKALILLLSHRHQNKNHKLQEQKLLQEQ